MAYPVRQVVRVSRKPALRVTITDTENSKVAKLRWTLGLVGPKNIAPVLEFRVAEKDYEVGPFG
jgi:hypothetical protein